MTATAVRYSLEEVTARAPGNSVEVRVPPFGVTQCVEGPRHTRGTPPNVIECDAATWLAMVTGRLSWSDAVDAGKVAASGLRADLSELLPLWLVPLQFLSSRAPEPLSPDPVDAVGNSDGPRSCGSRVLASLAWWTAQSPRPGQTPCTAISRDMTATWP